MAAPEEIPLDANLHHRRNHRTAKTTVLMKIPMVLLMAAVAGYASDASRGESTPKPGEPSAATEVSAAGRWAFQPARDDFSPDALLDLRFLNE